MSAREFNQSVAAAQRAAADEPVIITRRGTPAFVLLSIADYQRLVQPRDGRPLSVRLAPDDGRDLDDIDFPRDPSVGRPIPDF